MESGCNKNTFPSGLNYGEKCFNDMTPEIRTDFNVNRILIRNPILLATLIKWQGIIKFRDTC